MSQHVPLWIVIIRVEWDGVGWGGGGGTEASSAQTLLQKLFPCLISYCWRERNVCEDVMGKGFILTHLSTLFVLNAPSISAIESYMSETSVPRTCLQCPWNDDAKGVGEDKSSYLVRELCGWRFCTSSISRSIQHCRGWKSGTGILT